MTMLNSSEQEREPLMGRRRYLRGDYVIPYDVNNTDHQEGFVSRLVEQGRAHSRPISREHAQVVTNSIGQDFEVTLICVSDRPDSIGMTTTTEADFAEGHFLYLEDIVVTPEARQKGYGTQLIYSNLIDAWEQGFAGYAWETGRNNQSARKLYNKIDPKFSLSIDNHPDVWRLSARQTKNFSLDPASNAHLATSRDLNKIISTLLPQPDSDFGHIADILKNQDHNGFNADSFIVASNKGAITFASKGYSTFEGSRRSDVRLYIPDDLDKEDIKDLIKTTSHEIVRRKWRGSQHIELSNNVIGLDEARLKREKEKAAFVENILEKSMEAERLIHDGSAMIAYSLSGKRFVAAVIEAVNKTGRPLHPDSKKRLSVAANQFGLGLGRAA